MKREDERIQASLNYANNQEDIPIKDDFSRNICIALGQSFLKGSEWADKTMLDKVCEWLDGVCFDYIDLKHANVDTYVDFNHNKLIEDLRKEMEG